MYQIFFFFFKFMVQMNYTFRLFDWFSSSRIQLARIGFAWACRTLHGSISHLANIKSSRLCRTSPIALTFFFPLTDGHCHAHAHIINAQHNCLIAPFSNASKQFLLVILRLNINICCVTVPIRAEESFSPLTEFIVPVPPPPSYEAKKIN